jgi:hypothetical protein
LKKADGNKVKIAIRKLSREDRAYVETRGDGTVSVDEKHRERYKKCLVGVEYRKSTKAVLSALDERTIVRNFQQAYAKPFLGMKCVTSGKGDGDLFQNADDQGCGFALRVTVSDVDVDFHDDKNRKVIRYQGRAYNTITVARSVTYEWKVGNELFIRTGDGWEDYMSVETENETTAQAYSAQASQLIAPKVTRENPCVQGLTEEYVTFDVLGSQYFGDELRLNLRVLNRLPHSVEIAGLKATFKANTRYASLEPIALKTEETILVSGGSDAIKSIVIPNQTEGRKPKPFKVWPANFRLQI